MALGPDRCRCVKLSSGRGPKTYLKILNFALNALITISAEPVILSMHGRKDFPKAHSLDYCHGGCPGALQEAMHIFRGFNPDVDRQMQKVRYVVGKRGRSRLNLDQRTNG